VETENREGGKYYGEKKLVRMQKGARSVHRKHNPMVTKRLLKILTPPTWPPGKGYEFVTTLEDMGMKREKAKSP
jgi:hypothetical protein